MQYHGTLAFIPAISLDSGMAILVALVGSIAIALSHLIPLLFKAHCGDNSNIDATARYR